MHFNVILPFDYDRVCSEPVGFTQDPLCSWIFCSNLSRSIPFSLDSFLSRIILSLESCQVWTSDSKDAPLFTTTQPAINLGRREWFSFKIRRVHLKFMP